MRLISTSCPLVVAQEAKKGFGEDAYAVGTANDIAYMGVFDGCGGLGGRHYSLLNEHTGAWTASRVLAYSTEVFFKKNNVKFSKKECEKLHNSMEKILADVKKNCMSDEDIQIGGDLKKNFPSTVSLAVAEEFPTNTLLVNYVWAGDSRGYFLDNEGLCQVTYDDIDANGDDAFLNLYEDGRLTNVANADQPFELHQRSIELFKPAIVINATDGCFAYFKSPMEFEYVLLDTMHEAATPQMWLDLMTEKIRVVAGDDYTMTLGMFGFPDFEKLKGYFYNRYADLKEKYILDIRNADLDTLSKIWNNYKTNYYRRGL